MTYDEYRQHIKQYSHDTAVMSFVVVKHPDYQALQAAGDEIIPYLLNDLFDPDWHCNSCWGEGYEFALGWREEWEKARLLMLKEWDAQHLWKPWHPPSTGSVCPECRGKGNICTWACMHLLFEKTRARGDAPVIEDWMRGRHDALTNLWRKWGENNGLLPPTSDAPRRSLLTKLLSLFKLRKG